MAGMPPVLKVTSKHIVKENGVPLRGESHRPSRCKLDPAEVSELGEGQGQHLYLYVAPGQIGGQLAREKIRVRAREVDVAIEVDPHRIDRILPAIDSLGLVYEDVGAPLVRQAPANAIVKLVFRLDARTLAFQVDAHKTAASDPLGLDGYPDKVEKARLATPAHARNHLDEVGVTEEHCLLEVPATVPEPAALQELLLKLESGYTFRSIITLGHKMSKERTSRRIG